MKIGSRDRQTAAILRGIEASERYAKETRDKIDILEQKVDMLQAIVKEQQALVEKIVTNDNMVIYNFFYLNITPHCFTL